MNRRKFLAAAAASAAVARGDGMMTEPLQAPREQVPVHLVVVDDEQARRGLAIHEADPSARIPSLSSLRR